MLELIYPAVLGSVLIFALDVTRILLSTMAFWSSTAAPFDSLVLLKCLLLYVTVIFYGCDYVYTMLTREFQVTFFWYDCAFLIGLYVTLVNLKVVGKKELTELPVAWLIAGLYAFFLFTYLLWDRSEKERVRKKLEDVERSEQPETLREQEKAILNSELGFYGKVLRWEKLSLTAMVPTTIVAWWLRDSAWASVVLLVVVVLITRRFYRVVRMKRHFAFPDDAG